MTQRVFITGASGYVGAHLIPLALQSGYEVMALVSRGNPLTRLQAWRTQLRFIEGRLEDLETIASALRQFQPQTCIHLAWYVEPGKYLNAPQNLDSLVQSLALFRKLIEYHCEHVIMVGTCAEYDAEYGFLREDTPTKPISIYGATKLSLNLLGHQMAADANVNFTWARLFYLYGSSEDEHRLIPSLIKTLLARRVFPTTPGEQIRDYLHVEDVASALWQLVLQRKGGTFNISSGKPLSVRKLTQTVGDITGHPELIRFGALPYRNWEPMFICGDNQKLKQIGWQPRYSLEYGLQQAVEWWSSKHL